ncbi:ADP-ribosylglycohydrolase family protein, partial [Raoultella ornithinolytica]|nr:ADP-ribosylglycohydrolase family protein [Raoultella ornithinolytica]
LSAWEENNKTSLSNSIEKIKIELLNDIDKISKLVVTSSNECYHEILDRLGCLTSKFRGSGIKTALAASALAYMYKDIGIKEALICSANELDSDTDTIATMCGAMLGAICDTHPDWAIQDKDYIITEALRLMNMGNGNAQYQAFNYPDIGNWTPPVNQIDVVGLHKNNIAMMGLGELIPVNNEEFHANNAVWQWFSLPFGQTILVKRRNIIKLELNPEQLPKEITNQFSDFEKRSQKPTISSEVKNPKSQYTLPLNNCDTHIRDNRIDTSNEKDPLDQATDDVINSNFDDLTLGRLLNSCIDSTQSIQMAVSFTAIIAKAKIVRQRRKN